MGLKVAPGRDQIFVGVSEVDSMFSAEFGLAFRGEHIGVKAIPGHPSHDHLNFLASHVFLFGSFKIAKLFSHVGAIVENAVAILKGGLSLSLTFLKSDFMGIHTALRQVPAANAKIAQF